MLQRMNTNNKQTRILRKNAWLVLMLTMAFTFWSNASLALEQRQLCVFDPLGAYGDSYALIKEYAQLVKSEGVDFRLKPYTDEAVAANDFLGDACDAVVLSGTRARNFNRFTGSIEAIGAIPKYSQMRTLLKALGSPKLAKYMSNERYEVAGIYPLGAVYLFVNDRSIDTASELAGKRLAALSYDKAANTMVNHVGAAPVNVEITSIGGKFNNGSVDVCYAPAYAYNAFELYKGLEPGGGIIRFPLAQMNAQIIIKKDRFPKPFAAASRHLVQMRQTPKAFALVNKQDADIASKWWIDIPEADKAQYMEMFRGVRVALGKNNTYHKSMLKLLKRIRCAENAALAECSLNDE